MRKVLFAVAMLAACGDDGGTSLPDAAAPAMIGPAGGTVDGPNGAKLVVPAGALSAMVSISITEMATPTHAMNTKKYVGKLYWLQPEGQTFTSPVMVTIPYDQSAVPGNAVMGSFRIVTAAHGSTALQPISGQVNTTAHTITANVMHFSDFTDEVTCGDIELPSPCN